MQKIVIIGNVGNDAENKIINGNHYIAFSVACNEKYTNAQSETVESTTWYSVLKKSHPETTLTQYLTKGSKVYLEGKLTVGLYQNKDRVMVPNLKVAADNIQIIISTAQNHES